MPTRSRVEAAGSDPAARFVGVYAELIPPIWNEVRPLIARALERGYGGFAAEDILASLLKQEMQLWLHIEGGIKGAVVTELIDYPRRRACLIVLCAGQDVQDWIHHVGTLERWATARGCAVIEAYGRKGWSRLLEGWEQRVMLMKELNHAG